MDSNRKIKATDFYDVNSMKLPAQYSLYRAARWIAFGEKPIDQEYADILYRRDFSDDQEKEIFFGAARALHACLRDGSIKSFCPLWFDGTSGHYFNDATEEVLSNELWGREVNWIDGKLHYDDFETGVDITYCGIRVSTQDLMNKFPANGAIEKLSVPQNSGRPPKYNWPDFHAELTRKIHDDGFPTVQAELEKHMASWCMTAWGDIPTESTLRDKIAPTFKLLSRDRRKSA